MTAWHMDIRKRDHTLWERVQGNEEELRTQGKVITDLPGQKAWTCHLYQDGRRVAVCRRGEWSPVS